MKRHFPVRMTVLAVAVTAAMLLPAPAFAQFGNFLDALTGGGQQQNQGGGQQSTGDPLADALKQINLSEQIARKADELQGRLRDVIYTIKLYQALNGGVWYELGRQLNEVHKLDAGADDWYVKNFIAATREKRESGQKALHHVEINAVDDLEGQNHAIAANNGKIALLRKSVSAYVNAAAGAGTFDTLVANQDIPLDALMDAYLQRVGGIMTTMEGAALVFQDMSTAYDRAVGDMDAAIKSFEEQSGLVAAEVAKQTAVIAIQVLNVTQAMENANDAFTKVVIIMRATGILADLASVTDTLSTHQKAFDWFDANSGAILAASRGARTELQESMDTLTMLQPALMASWRLKMKAVSGAAQQYRNQTVEFESQLAQMKAAAPVNAAEVKEADMAELDTLMKKPRRRKKKK